MNKKDGKLLPAVFPCSYSAAELRKTGKYKYKRAKGLAPLPVVPRKKGTTYTTEEIVDHIKILPKRSTERASAINSVIKSGSANIGRTKIYECLSEAEKDAAWDVDTETIEKSKVPTDIMSLGLYYEGCHIDVRLRDKDLRWRGGIVLNLTPIRFCDNKSMSRRVCKLVGSKSYLKQRVDPSLHHIVKEVLSSNVATIIPIDICQLIGNSDIVERIPEGATSEDVDKMWLVPAFRKLCQKYNLPQLHWCTARFRIQELRIKKLYFSSLDYPPPSIVQNSRTMAKPKPVPPYFKPVLDSACIKASKTRSCCA